jgi:uncharacterized protein (TIGR03435 family)
LIHVFPVLLAAAWLCGFLAIVSIWCVRWRRISASTREAAPLRAGRELAALRRLERIGGMRNGIEMLVSSDSLEPGIFGIVRPVLLWPEGISSRLDDAQLDAILAHELWHVRRRDNLAAAIHMVVEAIFWFYPLVWWMGTRLIEERERACDEEVLQMGSQPQVYAESVLKVCEFYIESPIVCVSGVTGSDLKQRIQRIMSNRVGESLSGWRKLLLAAAAVATLAVPLATGVLTSPRLLAAQAPAVPDWQAAAGGRMAFDVASVKLNKAEYSSVRPASNIPLGAMDAFSPTGGLLQATNQPFLQYLIFAYKLTSDQVQSVFAQVPKWADTNHYDIQARASGNPTKDQFRLMMQSLLADRFKLAVHYETKQEVVFGLVLDKPGKIGPKLRLHPVDVPCSTAGPPLGVSATLQTDGFPVQCGQIMNLQPSASGLLRFGARNISMSMLATFFSAPNATGVNRPLVDKTGLTGTIDFLMEFAPEIRPGSDAQRDPNGPTFLEALKSQLGLKLDSTSGPVDVLVIDHVEEPSEN